VAIAGAFLLVFVLLVRPQEFVPALQSFSLLNACAVLAAAGIAAELVGGKNGVLARPGLGWGVLRNLWTPQVPWLGAFVLWCFAVTVARVGSAGFTDAWDTVGLSAIIAIVVASAARTLASFRHLAMLLVTIAVFLSLTSIHQSRQEPQCIAIDTTGVYGDRSGEGTPDGRECDNAWVCERQGKANTAYACEKVGLFGTFTEGRRVRWRGTLGDPNELALALGVIMPFPLAFAAASRMRRVALVATIVLVLSLWACALTGSRGGQLVVVTVLGLYFVRRYGFRGALVGAMLALPVLLFGGRAGAEAESSSLERIDLLYEGMDMIRAYPLIGVGAGQFVDHAYGSMTAHNSYVLAAAELGLPGSLLWLMLVYTSIKIPWVVAAAPSDDLAVFRPYAVALVVGFAGMLIGVFFLSFCYKALLFVYLGLSGALFGAVKRACPAFDVRVSLTEVARIAVADAAILVFVLVYSHIEGART
jgi:hypothetical protein